MPTPPAGRARSGPWSSRVSSSRLLQNGRRTTRKSREHVLCRGAKGGSARIDVESGGGGGAGPGRRIRSLVAHPRYRGGLRALFLGRKLVEEVVNGALEHLAPLAVGALEVDLAG